MELTLLQNVYLLKVKPFQFIFCLEEKSEQGTLNQAKNWFIKDTYGFIFRLFDSVSPKESRKKNTFCHCCLCHYSF